MRVIKNDDGTVTVTIPKTDEQYDPASGGLIMSETLTAEDYATALKAEPPAGFDQEAHEKRLRERQELEAQREENARKANDLGAAADAERNRLTALADQTAASEKARKSAQFTLEAAQARVDAISTAQPATPATIAIKETPAKTDAKSVKTAEATKKAGADRKSTAKKALARPSKTPTKELPVGDPAIPLTPKL